MKASNPKDKLILLISLNKLAKEEQSKYARLLFQENVIAILVISTLQTLASFLNKKIEEITLTEERKIEYKHVIQIEFDVKKFERKTLGDLCGVLYPYLAGDKKLRPHLEKFVTLRNKITHNMFFKYENFGQLENDSKEAVRVGEKAIAALDTFRDMLDRNA